VVVVRDAAEVGAQNEVVFFEEAPEKLVIRQETSLFGLFAVVGAHELDQVLTGRGRTHRLVFTWHILVVPLAAARQQLCALVSGKLPLQYEYGRATHAGELRVGAELLLDGGA